MTARHLFRILGWILIGSFTLLLFWNSWPYLTDPMKVSFYRERIHEAYSGWGTLLRVHVAGGLVCLFIGPFLFLSPTLRWVRHHIWGMLYLAACILMLPTGLVLAYSAHGGWIGQAGFLLTGIWMCTCVIRGMQLLAERNIQGHANWMMRSYAIACSALTFRLIYLAGFFTHLPYELNYPLSTWISSIVNLLLGELILRHPFFHRTPNQSQTYETSPPPRPTLRYGIPLR